MKKSIIIILLLVLTILIKPNISRSTINSIILTPANPTILSTGRGYYLAGQTYTFSVQVIDPDATAWGDITNVVLQIPNAGGVNDIQITTTFSGAGAPTAVVNQGGVTAVAGGGGAGAYNNFTITLAITFLWNMPESNWAVGRIITATATSSNPAPNNLSATQAISYGVSSTISALNMAMDGEASDGKVNRRHQGFNVTANGIVYNVPGATILDEVNTRTPAEMTSVNARFDLDTRTSTLDDNTFPAISVPINGSELNTWYTWSTTAINTRFRVTMFTAGALINTSNSLNLYCNEIQVTAIAFTGGGGINSSPRGYYRANNIPGTQIQVTAQLRGGPPASPTMDGNTDIVIRDSDGNNVTVTIPNGSNTGTAVATIPAFGAGNLRQKTYHAYNVTSGAYASAFGFGQNNNNRALIDQPSGAPATDYAIWWNNQIRPGRTGGPPNYTPLLTAGAFTTWRLAPILSPQSSADTFTLHWNELQGAAGDPNGDFDTYKIYYRTFGSAIWTMVDRNSGPAFISLGLINTNNITISGLAPLTKYDYQISAVDVFGNEVIAGERPFNNPAGTCINIPPDTNCAVSTTSSSVSVSLTDGITDYPYTSFIVSGQPTWSTLPALHPVRKAAIKITVKIITGGNLPEEVAVLFNNNNTDIATSGVKPQGGSGADDSILSTAYDTLICGKSAPNTWSAYIPSTHPLMAVGTEVRFILRTKFSGAYSFVDVKSYSIATNPAPGTYNDAEWRFRVSSEPTFQPWPVRILNNVMNAENPICYPAYYLTDDAYVTISVFDIKGRPVVTLLDKQLRKGGQNIKEGGWDGSNKATRKIGVGIYYVRFYATRASDEKVILNEFRKVVMAR